MPAAGTKVEMQLNETIRELLELSSRIDERIKNVMEKQSDMSDKIDEIVDKLSETSVRLAVLETADIAGMKDSVRSMEQRVIVLEKQMNNGIKEDVTKLKTDVHDLQIRTEHNDSFRTKGEARIEWWLNAIWKLMLTIGGAWLIYRLGIKQ